jgi:hypothetical protein
MSYKSALKGLITLGVVFAANAVASMVVGMDLPELSRHSDAIVHGKVVKSQARWTKSRRRIVTEIEIEIVESLKGTQSTRVVQIVQPGGEVDNIGQQVIGLASFEAGEEVVVFLQRTGPTGFAVAGMAQGKFKVERSTDGKAAFASPSSTDGLALVDPVTRLEKPSSMRTLELSELKRQIRAAVSTGKRRP